MSTKYRAGRSSNSWFKTEIRGGLKGACVELIDPSSNDGESGIVVMRFMMPSGVVKLD